eukprot:9071565-Alexandrium_andersonii.AAC.1
MVTLRPNAACVMRSITFAKVSAAKSQPLVPLPDWCPVFQERAGSSRLYTYFLSSPTTVMA